MLRLLVFLTFTNFFIFSQEYQSEQFRNEARDKLESGFEKTAIGAVEIGIGVWRASKGDVMGAAVATADGFNTMKDGVVFFKEAKDLFDQIREMERDYERFDVTPGAYDREY